MRHVAVLAKPVVTVWTDLIVIGIKDSSCRLRTMCLWLFGHLGFQGLVGLLVIRNLSVISEEEDTSRKEVDGRSLEELVRTTSTLFLAFLQRFEQRLSRFTGSGKIGNVFELNRIHSSAILYIYEVDDIELAALGHLASCKVFAVMIVEFGGQCRKLVVVNDHSKALGTMLTNERLDN